ncbi:MAG: hypothetical protein KGI29_04830 [Pseudomonadota bacterium]|nr:hypothetical protein [Pseudomonadota bacterium]MDE3038180.1 hypothetical protein [Pseudomonadota bacterium]
MSQYALNLALPPVYAEDNFFVSGCNREAHRLVMAWPDWAYPALLLYGPKGSGKSHLAHIWAVRAAVQQRSGSRCQMSENFLISGIHHPTAGALLLEDIERISDERALLHLLNAAGENGRSLLLTAAVSPSGLPFSLPDLTSRLKALPAIAIAEADDEALAAALHKQFGDRQMKIGDDIVAYIVPRMERSFSKVNELVELLDRAALAEGRTLTIPFVKRLLELTSA